MGDPQLNPMGFTKANGPCLPSPRWRWAAGWTHTKAAPKMASTNDGEMTVRLWEFMVLSWANITLNHHIQVEKWPFLWEMGNFMWLSVLWCDLMRVDMILVIKKGKPRLGDFVATLRQSNVASWEIHYKWSCKWDNRTKCVFFTKPCEKLPEGKWENDDTLWWFNSLRTVTLQFWRGKSSNPMGHFHSYITGGYIRNGCLFTKPRKKTRFVHD